MGWGRKKEAGKVMEEVQARRFAPLLLIVGTNAVFGLDRKMKD